MSFIISSVESQVMFITLNRPDKYNSFNREMALALQDTLDKAAKDKNVRAVYLTGAGKAFCAGQDLGEAIDPKGPGLSRIVVEHYNPIIQKIRNTEKPFVCGVNGVAAGAGANIALACDIVIAASSAVFIQAFSSIGLIPDSGGTFYLPRLIGIQRAAALTMLADKVPAAEALAMGMIYKTAENDKLQEVAAGIARTLATRPTKGIGLTKRLLNASMKNDLSSQLDLEAKFQVMAADSYDFLEGVKAFIEKRDPVFKGE